jgi:hypothetical protein
MRASSALEVVAHTPMVPLAPTGDFARRGRRSHATSDVTGKPSPASAWRECFDPGRAEPVTR